MKFFGGGKRDRTDDLMLAKHALSQLSYAPIEMVGLDGLEPSTPALSRRCSNQLSYRPASYLQAFVPKNELQRNDKCEHREERQTVRTALFKGGDPAAPSGTATLLRLHPSHEAHRGRRPPCG